MARRCRNISESIGCCCFFLFFFFFLEISSPVSCPLQSHAAPPHRPAAPTLQPERLQPITRGHSRAGFKADKCAGKHSGKAGNHIKFYYRHAVSASLFMEDGEAELPRQTQTSPNRSAFISCHSFQGNKAAGTDANSAVFMSRAIFLQFPLLSGAFHKHASAARTPLLSSERLLVTFGHFRYAAGASGLHLR